MTTSEGEIVLELFDEDAPKTVGNFKQLAGQGFYDGLIFHRIIPDFMIQGGCPEGTGTGGPGYTFEDEFNDHKVVRGALAMANAGPNTNGSQFFIVTTQECPWLDGKHTVFGQVTGGMDVIDKIGAAQTDARDKPIDADHDRLADLHRLTRDATPLGLTACQPFRRRPPPTPTRRGTSPSRTRPPARSSPTCPTWTPSRSPRSCAPPAPRSPAGRRSASRAAGASCGACRSGSSTTASGSSGPSSRRPARPTRTPRSPTGPTAPARSASGPRRPRATSPTRRSSRPARC